MKKRIISLLLVLALAASIFGILSVSAATSADPADQTITIETNTETPLTVNRYMGSPYAVVNKNVPFFTDDELTTNNFVNFEELDKEGRATLVTACLSQETLPKEPDPGNVTNLYPTGWKTKDASNNHQYRFIPENGGNHALFNRTPLLDATLANGTDRMENLVTGTYMLRYEGMQPWVQRVADYIAKNDVHVMYRVRPYFGTNELLCQGVLMEAKSVEDKGQGLSFCVFAYNAQNSVTLDYATGANTADLIRLYGDVRYDTCYAIADQLKDTLGVEKFDSMIVTYSKNFPDALSASYLATKKKAPILMVDSIQKQDVSDSDLRSVELALNYIGQNLKAGGTLYLVGGDEVIKKDFLEPIQEYLTKAKITVTKFAGENRYDTNRQVINEAGAPKNDVILCTGENYADALSASSTGKPICLINTADPKNVKETISYLSESLRPEAKITILGGENAVAPELEEALKEAGFTDITRLAGKDRHETSVMVAQQFYDLSEIRNLCLAWSQNFPDGLCGGPLAYRLGAPLVLIAEGADPATYNVFGDDIVVLGLGGPGSLLKKQLTDKAMNYIHSGYIKNFKM